MIEVPSWGGKGGGGGVTGQVSMGEGGGGRAVATYFPLINLSFIFIAINIELTLNLTK